jgi:hypothetical protein
MIEILVSSILLACGSSLPVPNLDQQPAQKIILPQPTLLSYSGRVAPGPDHGSDPHNEVHDYGLPAHPNFSNDPYGGTQPSDPYGGTQGWYQNPYAGTVPY